VRRRVGDDHPFLLDVNGLWPPLEAMAAGPALRELGVAAASSRWPPATTTVRRASLRCTQSTTRSG
jgi:hypothetical protein